MHPMICYRRKSDMAADADAVQCKAAQIATAGWWRLYLFATIFVYAIVTRIPFGLLAVYATRGLGLSTFSAIGSVFMFSVGRAVSATVMQRATRLLIFALTTLATAGYLMMALLLPLMEPMDTRGTIMSLAAQNRPSSTIATAAAADGTPAPPVMYGKSSAEALTAVYWLSAFFIGLSETISALDFFMKREVTCLPMQSQTRTFRGILVVSGFGSMTAYSSTYLYEVRGMQIIWLLGAGLSVLHTVMIMGYLVQRGGFDNVTAFKKAKEELEDVDENSESSREAVGRAKRLYRANQVAMNDENLPLVRRRRGASKSLSAPDLLADAHSTTFPSVQFRVSYHQLMSNVDKLQHRVDKKLFRKVDEDFMLYFLHLSRATAPQHAGGVSAAEGGDPSMVEVPAMLGREGREALAQVCTNYMEYVMARIANPVTYPLLETVQNIGDVRIMEADPHGETSAGDSAADANLVAATATDLALDESSASTLARTYSLVVPAAMRADIDKQVRILLPARFDRQLRVMQKLTVFWLACGAVNISNIIACAGIYWADVWRAPPGEVGLWLAAAEGGGMLVLALTSFFLGRAEKAEIRWLERASEGARTDSENEIHGTDTATETAQKSGVNTGPDGVLKHDKVLALTLQQPALQIWTVLLILYSSGVLGFWVPPGLPTEEVCGAGEGGGAGVDTESDVVDHGLRNAIYNAHVIALLCAGIGNALCHSSGTENMVAYLSADIFGSSLGQGYALKRVVNASWAAAATGLYMLSPQAPFMAVFGFYTLIYLPSLIWAFGFWLKMFPHQHERRNPAIEEANVQIYLEGLNKLKERAAKIQGLLENVQHLDGDSDHNVDQAESSDAQLRRSFSLTMSEGKVLANKDARKVTEGIGCAFGGAY